MALKWEGRHLRGMRHFRRFVVLAIRLAGWTIFVLGLIALTPLAYYYGNPLREPSRPQPSDVIVLLSHGQVDNQWLSPEGAQRTWAALMLYKAGFASVIISSGSSHGDPDQAALQAEWLTLAGVPSQAILVERKSARTYQSALEIAHMLKANGWQSAVIVTSELDVPRIRGVFRKLGYANLSFQQVPEFGPPTGSLYYHSGWRAFYHSTYEYAGLLLYKWRGWI
jgi:uncharacterized SAM-binding protein YcdF (DUF218 family)